MSMLLVHELHKARDRILLLKQHLEQARHKELPAYRPFIDDQLALLVEALDQAHIPDRYRVAVVGRFKVGKSAFVNKLEFIPIKLQMPTEPGKAGITA